MTEHDERTGDRFTELLSDYLDDDLAASERRALERHLETCAACRTTLVELRAVKERAAALVDPPAPNDLWAGIAQRIGTAGSTSASDGRVVPLPKRRFAAWVMPAAVAAALALASALAWTLGASHRGATVAGDVGGADTTQLASFDAEEIEGEIADLQLALDRGRAKLDPKTVEVLEKNLAVIRAATEDARAALAADPANAELRDYFAANVTRKLKLMRAATALAGV